MMNSLQHSRCAGKLPGRHFGTCRRWLGLTTSRTSLRRCALTRHRPSSKRNETLKNADSADVDVRTTWEKQLALKRDLALAVKTEDYRLAASLKKEITELDAALPVGVMELVLNVEKLSAATKSQDKLDALADVWDSVDDYGLPDFLEERCMRAMQGLFPPADSPVEANIQREFLELMKGDDVLVRDDGILEELLELMAVIKLEGARVMYDIVRLKQQRMSRKMELEKIQLLAAKQNITEIKDAWQHFKQHRLPFVSLALGVVLTLIEVGAIRFLPMQPYSAVAVGITLCMSSRWFLNVMVVGLFKALYGKDLQVVLGWVPERDGQGETGVVHTKVIEPEP